MNATRSPEDVLNALATLVQYEGDSEEEEYLSSEDFGYNPLAFATLKEAFLYDAHTLVRRIARTWGPLVGPLDAAQVAPWGERTEQYETLLLALFRKGPLVAYLVVRELRGGFGRLKLFLGVGLQGEASGAGGGEGDEARTWLPVPRAIK